MTGPDATEEGKLTALRTLIYESGPWNGYRPLEYDHADFKDLRVKILSDYLQTRRGNCVSMPILFLILADKLGLDVSLSLAPGHIFVRHHDRSGRVTNLETTSGANPARDLWYREIMPMSDRSVQSGLYLRTLSHREAVALMATVLLEHLNALRRYDEVIALSEILLEHSPRCEPCILAARRAAQISWAELALDGISIPNQDGPTRA